MQLYKWQRACLKAWSENECRGIVHVVTGAGKTVFAMAAIDQLRKKHADLQVKVVVPSIPLASQWKQELMHHASSEELRPGFYGGEHKDSPGKAVMIYVINSARAVLSAHIRRDLSLGKTVLLICDECHHYQSRENRKIFSFLDSIGSHVSLYHCLGLSATPFGTGSDEILERALGKEIYRYDYDAAAEEGVISPFTVCEVSASFLPDEFSRYNQLSLEIGLQLKKLLKACPSLQGLPKSAFMKTVSKMAAAADMDPSDPAAAFLIAAFQRKELTNTAASRINCALSILRQLPENSRVLLFCERIEQAQQLGSRLQREYGSCWGIYHSRLTKQARVRIMENFRIGNIRILVSCRCLDEGIDVPDAGYAIVLSSTSVSRQRIQRLGRIIRRNDQKDAACLYYIYIRESSDDAAYLPDIPKNAAYSVRYYTAEQAFANDLYEYVAAGILREAAKKTGRDKLAELRKCIQEGLILPDYLLPAEVQKKNQKASGTRHEQNYWITAAKIGQAFR